MEHIRAENLFEKVEKENINKVGKRRQKMNQITRCAYSKKYFTGKYKK